MELDKRYARQYVLLHPTDCIPPHGLVLEPGSRDEIKCSKLAEAFAQNGFDPNEPALVGYPSDGKIQLLSGTHRHESARRVNMMLPVHIIPRAYVEAYWGTDKWNEVIADIPIKDLECVEVKDNPDYPGIDERLNLEIDYK